ncbi:phage major capsid protein, P2 family [Sphingomonas sp. R647]|uniref:phage major capsid protein, P2 family n=1 Tax=Sphingomonas sp. R647 TaxID=2875233 RepID=UPI001CD209B1|nr:phage major capsid protein, P2 family [Sphingomonas sp. R647]MCA1199124.1 phage major capsid protein, P2 family [Sphingomonas sp. R647]
MRPETRQAFDAYCQRVSSLNDGAPADKKFTVSPSTQQTLEQKTQESSGFLKLISMQGVPELTGEKLGMNATSTVAGRTDTTGAGRRVPRDPTGLTGEGYTLKQTNYDVALRYDKLDSWAKFPNFQTMWQSVLMERCALDRIMIGWNGTSAAATTDRTANPLLQDVNIGWLEKMRTENETRVVAELVTDSNQITIGQGGDYRNLDALVMDMTHTLLPSYNRTRSDLVAITGADLLHDKYFNKVNVEQAPTEEIALEVILASRRLGGKQAMVVPYFPANAILVTPPKNLALYYQDGKRRRHIQEEPDADRVADYNSSNDGYVVEDYEVAFLLENVVILDPEEP